MNQPSFRETAKMMLRNSILRPGLSNLTAKIFRPVIIRHMNVIAREQRTEDAKKKRIEIGQIANKYYKSLVVTSGPFRGMEYPSAEAIGSALLPKLAGSYELEIADLFSLEQLEGFSDFFDIGCAEGYYAVGTAMVAHQIRVHAYDTNQEARTACRRMARQNGVEERVGVYATFDLSVLYEMSRLYDMKRTLLLVDCEGGERLIFSKESEEYKYLLKNSVVIIESHEFIETGIGEQLVDYFRGSHDIERILSIGDILRPSYFRSLLPPSCEEREARLILAEGRPAPMEWLVFKPLDREDQIELNTKY